MGKGVGVISLVRENETRNEFSEKKNVGNGSPAVIHDWHGNESVDRSTDEVI